MSDKYLLETLAGAANYIDLLGGDSKPYRFAIAKLSGDLVGMWDCIHDAERAELTKAFSQGFAEQMQQ